MTASEALDKLRDSRDAERDAPIWHDRGRTVAMLAMTAGVKVTFVHVELGRVWSVERRTADGREVTA